MFSGITNIFKVPPRQAENTDTRQEIRRHEPEYEQRKQGKRKKTPEELFSQSGSATVSVDALHVFLENFLKSQNAVADRDFATASAAPEAAKPEESGDPGFVAGLFKPPQAEEENPSAVSGAAAHAAQAYQSMARNAEDRNREHLLADASLEDGPEIVLSSSDVRVIHRLLGDLKQLEARDIHFLHIERSESFLDSLVEAVDKAKGGF